MLYQISRQVSKFYSFPVLVVIFIAVAVVSISLQVHFIQYMVSVNSIFWILMCAYPITVLSASVNTFHTETDRTADIVYEIVESYDEISNKTIQSELNNFAIELLHKKVTFTACGVFSLDCSLPHSIFGMIVRYLLILLQFKPTEG